MRGSPALLRLRGPGSPLRNTEGADYLGLDDYRHHGEVRLGHIMLQLY